jgi:outer membrane lipoprotein
MKRLIPLVIAAALGGCAVVPAPFQVSNEEALVPFDQVINQPVLTIDTEQQARWGGQVVSVQNKGDMSELEIVYFPESSNGKPAVGIHSPGRFKVIVEGEVDTALGENDSLVTVLGKISAPETGMIGSQEYTYPTLQASSFYVWNDISSVHTDSIGEKYTWKNRKHDVEGALFGPTRSKFNKRQ